MARIAYLGPAGTFTEEALLTQTDLANHDLIPAKTMTDVLTAVDLGEVDLGFVPIENAIEGTVNVTLDGLIFDSELLIQREVTLPIHLHLSALPGVSLGEITEVASYPVALAQVRGYLERELPHAQIVSATSTAEAVKGVSDRQERHVAAIGPALAAKLYGLDLIAEEIEDHSQNATRFVLVAKSGIPAPTGHDKTSIVCFQSEDVPGSLQSMLSQFSARGIQMTKLESRTTKQGLGKYCFVIDLDGHIADEIVADALLNLRANASDVKFLGSYPAAGDDAAGIREDVTRRWAGAHNWLDGIRAQIKS